MGKSVFMSIAASGRVSWTADDDYVLEGVVLNPQGAAAFLVLSTNPTSTGLGNDSVTDELFFQVFSAANNFPIPTSSYALTRGMVLFFYCSGSGGSCTLLLS